MKFHYLTIVFFFFMFGCVTGSDDDAIDPDDILDILGGEKNAITAKVNGNDFKASGVFAFASVTELNNNAISLSISGVRTNGTEAETVTITLYNTDWDSIQDGAEFIGGNSENFAIGIYGFSNGGDGVEAGSSQDATTKLKIVHIDKTNNLISGTFSFTSVNTDDANDTYTITDGVFNEIEID